MMNFQKLMLVPAALVRYELKTLWTAFVQWNKERSTKRLQKQTQRIANISGQKTWLMPMPLFGRRIVTQRQFNEMRNMGLLKKGVDFMHMNKWAVYTAFPERPEKKEKK